MPNGSPEDMRTRKSGGMIAWWTSAEPMNMAMPMRPAHQPGGAMTARVNADSLAGS